MKNLISKAFNNFADGLVIYSLKYGRPSWLIVLFVFALLIVLSNPLAGHSVNKIYRVSNCTQDNNSAELRGVWLTNIDSDVLFEKENISQAIDNLAKLNFNTIYPTVWNWGHTLYPSEVAQRVVGYSLDPEPKLQGRDVLKEVIDLGHKKNLSVIPWFEFGFMAPADSELAKRHPDWLTQRHDRTTIWWEGKAHKRVWLNPLRPDVQQFITELILEVVSNYQVDGIQLDDHFGFPSDFGYDSFTVKLYQKEHNGKLPPVNPLNKEWIRWRADKITAYMKKLFKEIKSINPDLIVSLSPNPQKFSLEAFLLDWQSWERMGLIEELILQVYRTDNREFIKEIRQPEVQTASKNIPVAIGILSGLKDTPMSVAKIEKQVKMSRDRGFAGVSFFFYESLWNMAKESPTQRQSSLQSLFSKMVKRPNLINCWNRITSG
ncbi:MAG: glycoside hydrolase family 10 protein [Xenococcaceae cyanobacterium]